MKAIIVFLISVAAAFAAVDLSKPIPRLPLGDGRVLEQASFIQFRVADIAVRHTRGTMVLRYEALPDEIRAEAEKKRPGGPKWFPGEVASSQRTVEGQVFVQTRGAGPYKFGNVKVYAFDAKHLDAWNTNLMTVTLPKPLAVATTDGDGRFKLSLPKDTPYFVFCTTRRLLGQSEERNEWRVRGETFKDTKSVVLSNDNATNDRIKPVQIEETP